MVWLKQIIHTQMTPFQYRTEAQGQKKGEMPVSLLLSLCQCPIPLPAGCRLSSPFFYPSRSLFCCFFRACIFVFSSKPLLFAHFSVRYSTTALCVNVSIHRSYNREKVRDEKTARIHVKCKINRHDEISLTFYEVELMVEVD